MPQNFFTITLRNFPFSTHLSRDSYRLNHLHPQHLGIFLIQPHLVLKQFNNSKLKYKIIPSHHSYRGNGKARPKPLSIQEKSMPTKTNKPNEQMYIPWIQTSTRKSHMQPITCRIFLLKFMIQPFLGFLAFLFLPLLASPSVFSLSFAKPTLKLGQKIS